MGLGGIECAEYDYGEMKEVFEGLYILSQEFLILAAKYTLGGNLSWE